MGMLRGVYITYGSLVSIGNKDVILVVKDQAQFTV
jgi:hypothetical protein